MLVNWCFEARCVYYLSGSAGRRVALEREEVVELVLLGGHAGEHALGAGAPLAAVVEEQDGFLDAGEFGQQFTHG